MVKLQTIIVGAFLACNFNADIISLSCTTPAPPSPILTVTPKLPTLTLSAPATATRKLPTLTPSAPAFRSAP